MTRVVIDTNVLVSALLNEHGAEAAVLRFVHDGKLVWCVSEAVLAEYDEVLSRPKFAAVDRRHCRPARARRFRRAGRGGYAAHPVAG